MKTRSLAAVLSAALLLGFAGCAQQDKTRAASPKISRCAEELNGIPEIAALRKTRNNPEQPSQKPFEGLELALTINDMVTSHIDTDNVDDLCYTQDTRENFDKLVNFLTANNMPPTAAFIEGLYFDPMVESEWLKSGNLLGNLTYDRRKAKKSHGQEFVDNIARNDHLLASVWKAFPPRTKYFRHPHPKISDAQDRAGMRAYFKQNGYVEVPITIESPDRLFSQMYCGALAKGNIECANLIKANFFSLLLDATVKGRADARGVAGREIKHILAIRASQLTIDTLAEMLVWFKGLGARFISLDEALSDPFYADGNVKPGVSEATPHAPVDRE